MIVFHKVTKRFGSHTVLDKLDFSFKSNEFVVLQGISGAGKSTLINLLLGADKPNHGYVEVDGFIVNEMDTNTRQLYRRGVGVIFQDYKLLPRKTVFQNVAFAMEACNATEEEIHARVPQVLTKVGLLHFQDKYPDELSGGERQRVAIARALVHNPRLIIADEPTGNLDQENAKGIVDIFNALHKEGATLLITTHQPMVQKMIHGRHVVLEGGRIHEKTH